MGIPNEQKTFLRNKLANHPELLPLRKKLLSMGGEEIVPRYEGDLDEIMRRGKMIRKNVRFIDGSPGSCHSNVAILYQRGGIKIVTGWALSDDGLWRQHTWGIDNNGIIETTEVRDKYFGFILNDTEAELFVDRNVM